jgi:hypothetical protein
MNFKTLSPDVDYAVKAIKKKKSLIDMQDQSPPGLLLSA